MTAAAPSLMRPQSNQNGKGGGSAPQNGKGGGNAPDRMIDATYNRYKTQLDPRFGQAEDSMKSDLAAQGFMTNSAGYDKAMGNFNQSRDRAYQDASDSSVQTGINQWNTMQGLGLQNKSLDNQFSLGNKGLDLQRSLGMGGLNIQQQGMDLNRDQFGFNQEMGRGQLDLNRVLGLGGLQLAHDQFGEQQYQNELANQLQLDNNSIQQLGMLGGMIPTPEFSPNYNIPITQIMGLVNGLKNNQYQMDQQSNQGMWGNLAGLGGALGGAAIMASSHGFKENKRPAEPVLDKLNSLVVEKWNYKPEMGLGQGTHTGPYAEDWAATFGGNGKTISVISMMGVMMKAIQELSQKVETLSNA